MKKTMILGILLNLCGIGMGAEYLPATKIELQSMDDHEQQDAHINLEDFGEDKNTHSDAAENKIEETDRNKETTEIVELFKYYHKNATYYHHTSAYLLQFLPVCTLYCIAGLAMKFAVFQNVHNGCKEILRQGGICEKDPCNLNFRNNNSDYSLCMTSQFADSFLYCSVVAFIGVSCYVFYRMYFGPWTNKYGID